MNAKENQCAVVIDQYAAEYVVGKAETDKMSRQNINKKK